ncbi:MAG TPA: hotdog domain-containing protein [Yinghuangia sp.]|nr:hotdog domain-containing protein [Yinghuangia sp.]
MTTHNTETEPLSRRGGGPTLLFGVRVNSRPDGEIWRAAMDTGPWTAGLDGTADSAALSVLIDATLGRAATAHRPANLWPVTTELSIDYPAPPPCDGQGITFDGRVVAAQQHGALVTGTAADETGRPLAVATLRSRFIPGVTVDLPADVLSRPGLALSPEDFVMEEEPPHRESLMSILNASLRTDEHAATLRVPGDPLLANGTGAMHGGIALCASQLAASHLIGTADGMAVASARITYVRQIEMTGDTDFVARIVHAGRTFRLVEVTAYTPNGKVGTVTTIAGYAGTRLG